MAGRFSIEAVFKAVDKVTAPVSRMQNRVGKFTRSMGRGFRRLNKGVDVFTSGIKRAALAATVAATLAAGAGADVISVGADFDRAIGSAAVKFPEQIQRGTKAFEDLRDTAREVGSTTEFTATQAANGLNFLAKAGFNANFSMKALADIVDFATASEIELAEASDIASDALGAFGLDSQNATKKMEGLRRVMDVMSLTANSTNTSVSELFESVKKAAPVASAAGVSIETYAATMGFLASNGIKASEAGTAAKNITLALAGVGNKAAVVFKRLGINLADSNGDMRDQLDVLDELRKKLAPLGSQAKLNVISAIFGKIPIASATKLLDDSTDSVRKLRGELERAGGSTKRVAGFIRNDVKGSLDSLNSAIEGVKLSIFDTQKGPLKDTIDRMTEWVRVNEDFIASKIGEYIAYVIDNFDTIVSTIKSIGKWLFVFFILVTVLKTLTGVLTLVNLVMAANPVTLIILGILALVAAVAAAIYWFDELKDAFMSAGAGMDYILGIIGIITGPIGMLIALALSIVRHWEPLKAFFTGLWDSITLMFDMAIAGMINKITMIGDKIKQFARSVGEFFGFGDSEVNINGAPQTSNPQERALRSIEETRESATVTLRDETGRAEVTEGSLNGGVSLVPSGAF